MTEPHDIVFCSRKRSPSPIPVVATDHRLLQQLLQPPFGSLFVAAALDQHVEHHPALVGCAPEPMLHPGDLDDYLILSANSGDCDQGCKAGHACFGSRLSIQPMYHP
jgi:hypothetical protein